VLKRKEVETMERLVFQPSEITYQPEITALELLATREAITSLALATTIEMGTGNMPVPTAPRATGPDANGKSDSSAPDTEWTPEP
jgi:hypothetical protein